MKRWTQIFRVLANVNRLKIIKLLSSGGRLSVSDITAELEISFVATSRHLIFLRDLEVLDNEGKQGHVFYFLNRRMPLDIQKAIGLFIKQ